MKRVVVCALAVALAVVSHATASLPSRGVFVVGRSLGGIRLGDTSERVRAKLGGFYGVCDGCAETTWYFTYRPYTPRGLGVTFRGNRVIAVVTLWQPRGWRTARGVQLGDDVARVQQKYGPQAETDCGSYSALQILRGGVVSAFYVVDDRVWGFGLLAPGIAVCR